MNILRVIIRRTFEFMSILLDKRMHDKIVGRRKFKCMSNTHA